MMEKYVDQLHSYLEKQGYSSSRLLPDEENPTYRFHVYVGKDYRERDQIMEITLLEQFTPHPIMQEGGDFPKHIRISFQAPFAFSVEDQAIPDSASLLHYINRMSDFPGFQLDELEGRIQFCYTWLVKNEQLDPVLFGSILGLIQLNCDLFAETVEQVADGSVSFNEILEQMVQLTGA